MEVSDQLHASAALPPGKSAENLEMFMNEEFEMMCKESATACCKVLPQYFLVGTNYID
jgi:hypothetical protein